MEEKDVIDIFEVKVVLDRILDHHVEFKAMFKDTDKKLDGMLDRINSEEKNRLMHAQLIKDELHGRINKIILAILGGSTMFILGVVMFLLERKI